MDGLIAIVSVIIAFNAAIAAAAMWYDGHRAWPAALYIIAGFCMIVFGYYVF